MRINHESVRFEYREEFYTYFFWKKKIYQAGFYGTMLHETTGMLTNEEILDNKNLYIKDKLVYLKPHLFITMSNKQTCKYFFKSEEELKSFVIEKGIDKWIIVKD